MRPYNVVYLPENSCKSGNTLAQQRLAEITAYQPNNQGWFGRALAAFRRIFEN
ncbi:MAG: hypothetical protein RM021_021665 [Nostoc sp. EkiNYC01]|nr:hypothetical protein [Nostoc sp. EkiNYC01]